MCLPRVAEGMPGNARACGLMGGSLAVRKTSMTHRADTCTGSTILVITVSWPCSLPSWYLHTSSFEATWCETVLQEPVISRWLQGVISLALQAGQAWEHGCHANATREAGQGGWSAPSCYLSSQNQSYTFLVHMTEKSRDREGGTRIIRLGKGGAEHCLGGLELGFSSRKLKVIVSLLLLLCTTKRCVFWLLKELVI